MKVAMVFDHGDEVVHDGETSNVVFWGCGLDSLSGCVLVATRVDVVGDAYPLRPVSTGFGWPEAEHKVVEVVWTHQEAVEVDVRR